MNETELVVNHLRSALRNSLILLPIMFVIGIYTGWAGSAWSRTRWGAVAGGALGLLAAGWLIWVFYRTRGLLHDSASGNAQLP